MRDISMQITAAALADVQAAARAASPNECVGLLAGRERSCIDTTIGFAADAGAGRATASPAAVAEGAERLRRDGLCPLGLWHSHGELSVFHSGTDTHTIDRLFPALAEASWETAESALRPPEILPGEIVVPALNGQAWRLRLLGRLLSPDADLREPVDWLPVQVTTDPAAKARAITISESCLSVTVEGVRYTTAIPEGSTLEVTSQRGAALVSRLYSLVVNERGDHEFLEVRAQSVAGGFSLEKRPTELLVREGRVEPLGGALLLNGFAAVFGNLGPRRGRGLLSRLCQ